MSGVSTLAAENGSELVEFRILGPVEASRSSHPLSLGTPRMRALLSLLLVRAGQIVTVDQIADELWPEGTSVDTRSVIHAYTSRLRRALGQTKGNDGGQGLLVTRSPGYLLRISAEQLDLYRFERLAGEAANAAQRGDHQQAVELWRSAHSLWRGEALADVPASPALEAEASRLAAYRLASIEDLMDAELAAGASADLVPELTALVAEHPLRERIRALLMLALYRSGRQTEALRLFRDAREVLVEELGVEPGPELIDVHQRILRGDTELIGRPASSSPPIRLRRNELPADIARSVGRQAEVARLMSVVPSDPAASRAVAVAAIDGMAGVGKTTLAVHVAHQLADRYPDAQLFVDLHGYTAGQAPLEPAAALSVLLRAVGVPDARIPGPMTERAALWRAELAGRRVLLVLDNVADASQVRPLLPGSAGCLTLITSRRRMTDLDNAHIITLDPLSPDEAKTLLTQLVGAARAAAEPQAVVELVRMCGHLPLAVRIASARLRGHPTWTVRHLLKRLRDKHRRLDELVTGDRSVAAVFATSYQRLAPEQQRMFRLLGLLQGEVFGAGLAAAAADTSLEEADRLLQELGDVHLLEEPSPGYYRFHELLRQHAYAMADQTEGRSHKAVRSRPRGHWPAGAPSDGFRHAS